MAYGDFIDQLDSALSRKGLPGQWQGTGHEYPGQGQSGQDQKLNNSMAALQDAIKGMPAAVQPQVNALLKQFTDGLGMVAKQYRQQQQATRPATPAPQPVPAVAQPAQAWVIGNCKFAQAI